jgi:hypothetical protein
MAGRDITLSIVSHGQNALVNQLLGDIQKYVADRVTLVLTENIPDPTPLATSGLGCPVERIANTGIKGFGANHNAAFTRCRTACFCVVNPDIRLTSDPFPALMAALERERAGVAGPLVRSPAGAAEDSARRFPTFASLLKKAFRDERRPDYPVDRGPQRVDWVAGMFMLFPSDAFRAVGGFDEAYFLYYEDVDLCRRLNAAGRPVVFEPTAEVVHAAQRASRRNPRLALHHLSSIARFLSRR